MEGGEYPAPEKEAAGAGPRLLEVRRKLDEQHERVTERHVTDEDIVRLNVGGHQTTTTRGTLCQAEDSYLASLCSGRWDTTTKDESGAYFLDLDPECMTILMRYLRQRRLTPSDQATPPPEIKKELEGVWQATIEYLGLTDFIDDEFEPRLELDLVFGDTLTRAGDGYYIPCGVKNTCQAICTKPLMKTTAWRFRVGSGNRGGSGHYKMPEQGELNYGRRDPGEIRFGVFKEIDTDVLFQMGKKSLYGWSSQGNAYQRDDGSRFETPQMVVDGDVVHLRLSLAGSHLEMWNQRLGRVFKISLPTEQARWYFQIYMNGSYWVQMLPLSRAEALATFASSA